MVNPIVKERIDWGEVWRQRYMHNASKEDKKECSVLWQDRKYAGRYDENARAHNWCRGRRLIRELSVTARSSILDIGAGPGTLAIPAASLVKHVTAVEPADGMMSYLKKNIREQGLDNVTCIGKKWEHVDISHDLEGPHDVVVASMSLGMPDIGAALKKMNDAASKYVYLFWPAGVTYWESNYAEIWLRLHGEEFQYGLKCDCLFNVLYGMGICPNVKVYRDEYLETFTSVEEAVDHFKPFYGVADGAQENVLREFLRRKLKRQKGHLVLKGYSNIAKLWWKKRGDFR